MFSLDHAIPGLREIREESLKGPQGYMIWSPEKGIMEIVYDKVVDNLG